MKNFLGGRKGTSLIEILVVMVVLLIGIMTVIQMFPTGFKVVRQAESRTIATRLAQQEIERWKNMAANLPDGILPVDANGNVLNDQLPGPPFEGFKDDGTLGNARNIRWVRGETTTIPTASYFDSGSGEQYGCRYTLAFSPVAAKYDPATGDVKGIDVRSVDLSRITRYRTSDGYDLRGDPVSHTLPVPHLTSAEYAIDYGDEGDGRFYVTFPTSAIARDRIYTISYSYLVEVGGQLLTKSVVNQDIVVTPGLDGTWIPVEADWVSGSPPAGFVLVDDGTDTCSRKFNFLLASDPWTSDPYEFKVPDYILGVISFNPRAHRLAQTTFEGRKPLNARIDYVISDVRIIREDRVVPVPRPGANDIPIKLSLRFILNIGDPTDNPDEPEYQGLIRSDDGTVVVALPMLIIDLATGLRVDAPTIAIDFKNGSVRLPLTANLVDYSNTTNTANVPLAGRNVRFFYRADGDWSIQCTKAYVSYTRKRSYEVGDPDYRSFKSVNANTRLLFAPCEYGKMVTVDYEYFLDGALCKAVGKAFRVEKDGVTSEVCVDLMPPVGAVIAENARITVVGSSFTARAIWRDGTVYRHVDMDTDLTRE